ncbi:MAG: TonB-dependent receptor [Lacibacter sp.]
MKLTILLAVFCTFHASAGLIAQNISIKASDTEISKVLTEIQKQGDYRFLFNSSLKDLRTKVSVNFERAELEEVMKQLFSGTTLTYTRLDNNLIAIRSNSPEEKDIRVTGKVTSDNGDPIAAASVVVKGTSNGTVTDAGGNFSITVPDNAVLVISAVGYNTVEVSVAGKQQISVKLEQSTKKMDEVVVIGYGTASKRDLTGSIIKVSGKDVADKPNTNPVASLQGKVSGLYVVNSGTPGKEPDIRIRGTNSLSGDVKPLYLVDGNFQDNINYLNPADIESVEILKDPSSLAIFGVRGANGVIAITTKKAKVGQININFNTNFGIKKLVDKIKMVDAAQFRTLYDEEQSNLDIPLYDRKDLSAWTGNTDWINEMTRTAIFNATNLSISTATDKNRFYISFGRTYDEGIVKNQQLTKYSINLSDEVKLSNNFKVGFTLMGLNQRNPYSAADGLLTDARRTLPITPVFNSARNAYYDLAIQSAQMTNPAMVLNNNWNKELAFENRYVGSVFAEWKFLKDFTLRSTVYGDFSYLSARTYSPLDSVYNPTTDKVTSHRGYLLTSIRQSEERWRKWQQDHTITFKKAIGDHNVTLLGGFTTYESIYRGMNGYIRQSATGKPIPNDKRFWYLNTVWGDVNTQTVSSGQWEKATVSGLLRGLYNYQGKYIATLSYRRDASSAWRPELNNQADNFYSIGLAWDVTKENFFTKQNVFDYLKIKGSYGKLGVQNTYGYDYPAYPTLSPSYAIFGTVSVPVYYQNYIASPDLHWERVFSREIGFEFAMLNNRLNGDFTYYRKDTKGLMAIIGSGASDNLLKNLGDMRNRGIEASLSYNHTISKDMNLSVSGNITTFDNRFLNSSFSTIVDEQYPNRTEPGYPVGYFYGLKVAGIIQSYADKNSYLDQSNLDSYGPGDFKYVDVNGDGVITTDDRTTIGNPTPDFTYGGNITYKYKQLDISMDFQGVYGNEIYRYWGSSENPYTTYNYPAFRMNRWHGEGTSNWEPLLGAAHKINRYPSTYGIEDGSYFRIRNLQIGYNFAGEGFLKKLKVKNMRLFVNAQNLKTWKHNSGYTPEFGGSAIRFGIDDGNNPMPAIYTGGININF